MMERIGSHLSYLSKCSSAFHDSEDIQKVRVQFIGLGAILYTSIGYSHYFTVSQVLVEVYCDLLNFYVKVRGIFLNEKNTPSCECEVKS